LEKNSQAHTQTQGELIFNPSVTIRNSLTDCFCIFIDPSRPIQIPAYRLHVPLNSRQTNDKTLTIFTDGSCTNNGKQNAKCSGGI
ncbi:hypothetical protein BDR04DRAFT_1024560, partial [Suillus decipiens]